MIGVTAVVVATCRSSVAGRGQSREKRRVRGEPAGYELREKPHALRLSRLTLREEPQRSVPVQVSARHPHQQRVGISDEARQRSSCRAPAVPRRSAPRHPWS